MYLQEEKTAGITIHLFVGGVQYHIRAIRSLYGVYYFEVELYYWLGVQGCTVIQMCGTKGLQTATTTYFGPVYKYCDIISLFICENRRSFILRIAG